MKKFRFSMESVLRYRQQMLDAVQVEYAERIARVREQEAVVDSLNHKYAEVNAEYRIRKAEGITVAEAFGFDLALQAQHREIQRQEQVLRERRAAAESKRNEMVQARRAAVTIENLRDKKLSSYNKAVQKDEEKMIDEMVSAARVAARSEAG